MKNFNFWQKWLLVVSLYLVVFGIVLAFFSQSRLMDLVFNNHIDPIFWPRDGIPENVIPFQGWIYGVLGAVVSGWGIFMVFLVHVPFKARERWAWNCIAAGVTVWFVTDSAISAFYCVTFNVLFNTLLFLLVAIPLVCTRKNFSE